MRMPAILSTYAVPGDDPSRPADAVATASTMRPFRRLSGRPSSSVSPAAVETPMKVDSESNRSVKRIATIEGSSDHCSAPVMSSARTVDEKSGRLRICAGAVSKPRPHASPDTTAMAVRNASGFLRCVMKAATRMPSSRNAAL